MNQREKDRRKSRAGAPHARHLTEGKPTPKNLSRTPEQRERISKAMTKSWEKRSRNAYKEYCKDEPSP